MTLSDKPVHKDQVFHNAAITEMSNRGDGVTRIQGLVIFVPHTKIGDHVNIIITRVGARSAQAEVLTSER